MSARPSLPRPRRALAAALLFATTACGGAPDDAEDADARAEDGADGPAAVDVPRLAAAATGAGQLPDAIVGEAPAPRGTALHYFPEDGATTGYVVAPEGEGPFPAVILIHEWNGLTDRVRQLADDLAEEGYVALAADLFGGRTGSSPEENRALTAEVRADEARMIRNLDAAHAWLREQPWVAGRIGAMGWCFGGGVALSYGLGGEAHDATAIFYGSLLDDPDTLAALSHEVYGTFAELDRGIPPEAVASFEAALREAGVESDLHVYDAVDHGFWLRVDGDPETRTEPARDAWDRLKAYLDRTLGG